MSLGHSGRCARAALLFVLALTAPTAGAEPLVKRVLFIGNSYTAQTHPQLVGFCQSDPGVSLVTTIAVAGGVDLGWHYSMRDYRVYYGGAFSLVEALNQQPWDVVVLQEFSTMPTRIGDVARFMTSATALADLIRTEAPTAAVWFFETWARRADNQVYPLQFANTSEMQADLRTAYTSAAAALSGTVVPVGDAWERAYAARPYIVGGRLDGHGEGEGEGEDGGPFTLHINDGSHPNDRGQYLTGAVFYETLFQRSSAGVGYRGAVSCSDATFLRRIASETTLIPAASTPPQDCCQGDCTGDRIVDFRDLNTILSQFGQVGYGLAGDVDVDGQVDFGDLNVVLTVFGQRCF